MKIYQERKRVGMEEKKEKEKHESLIQLCE